MSGHTKQPWAELVNAARGVAMDDGERFHGAPSRDAVEWAVNRIRQLRLAIIERAKRDAREYDDGEHEWRAYLTPAEADAIAMVEEES